MSRAGVVLAALFALPILAWAGPDRGAVMDLLNQLDGAPTAQDWVALGDGVDAELMAIADDDSVPSSRRGRAVTALQHFPTDGARAFLEGKLAVDAKAILRRKAIWSLAVGWGAGAIPQLESALSDDDVQLRMAAAAAFSRVPEAHAALRERRAVETVSAVQAALDKAVGE